MMPGIGRRAGRTATALEDRLLDELPEGWGILYPPKRDYHAIVEESAPRWRCMVVDPDDTEYVLVGWQSMAECIRKDVTLKMIWDGTLVEVYAERKREDVP